MRLRLTFSCLSLLAAVPGAALACATCLCGDPTITTMGSEKPFAGRLRGGIERLTRGETVGNPGLDEHKIKEQRTTLSLSYAPSERWILALSVPVVEKKVRRFDLSRQRASGLGDTDLSARWYIGHGAQTMSRHLWGVQVGIRLPTSREQKSNGTAIDFDAQPGAGAAVPNAGIWYGYFRPPAFFFASTIYQHAVDTGYQGYEAGDVFLLTAYSQYAALEHKVALSLSLDGRWKERDRYYGATDKDSGGVLVMATPGIAWTPIMDLIFNASYQIPALENLNGRQIEKPVFRIGATYDF
jgi:hypothetical protein